MPDPGPSVAQQPARKRLYVVPGMFWAFVVAATLFTLSRFEFIEKADKFALDLQTLWLSESQPEQRNDITIVLITENSLADYPYRSPIDRGLVANLLRVIDEAGAAAIGVDLLFDRRTEPSKDTNLFEVIKKLKTPVVLGSIEVRDDEVNTENYGVQAEFFAAAGKPAGHIFFARDDERFTQSDNVIRYVGKASSNSPYQESFAEQLVKAAGRPFTPKSPYIDWLLPPTDGSGTVFPIFQVQRHTPLEGSAPPDAMFPASWRDTLKGKIVLIGGHLYDVDKHRTPFSIADGAGMPGVLIHAYYLAQLLDHRSIKTLEPWAEFVLLAGLTLAGFIMARQWRIQKYDRLFNYGFATMILIAAALLFATSKWIIPSATFMLAWAAGVSGAYNMNITAHATSNIRKRFGFVHKIEDH